VSLDANALDRTLSGLLEPWCPRALAPDGGFHERLDRDLEPVDLGYRRLVVQCRQVFVFAEGARHGVAGAADVAARGFEHLCTAYRTPVGGWRFALGDGQHPSGVPGETHDLYGHAFVLLACAAMHELTADDEPLRLAFQTLTFLNESFRAPGGGFEEALDADLVPLERVRRQNPHMHLLEGCVFAFRASGDEAYGLLADELVQLLDQRFYDDASHTLGEFFDRDLCPHGERGNVVEPGHHFEWVWLLARYRERERERLQAPTDERLNEIMGHLLHRGYDLGRDPEHGGFFDAIDRTGNVLEETKRIWPVTEACKAFALMRRFDESCIARLDETWRLLEERYLSADAGRWNEVLARDLTPTVEYLPGTTLYHLVMALRELRLELS